MTKRKRASGTGPKGRKRITSYSHSSVPGTYRYTDEASETLTTADRRPRTYQPELRTTGSRKDEPRLSWHRGASVAVLPTVPSHPLYVMARVRPEQWVNELRRDPAQLDIFADDESAIDAQLDGPLRYNAGWENRLIKGESSRVMASLVDREGLRGQVKMVYYDPPYGINWQSNFQSSIPDPESAKDGKALPDEPEPMRAFRDTWKNGVHSYLDTILRNAHLIRDLLTDDGSLFLQIGIENMARLTVVLDEVFGATNRIATIPFKKSNTSSSATLPEVCDFLLWYSKDRNSVESAYQPLYLKPKEKELLSSANGFTHFELPNKDCDKIERKHRSNPSLIPPKARLFKTIPLHSQGESTTGLSEPLVLNGETYKCPRGRHWSIDMEGLQKLHELGRIHIQKSSPRLKIYDSEYEGPVINNMWTTRRAVANKHYACETSPDTIARCMLMSTEPGDLVLDITCGSGTTPFVAECWGRRWIATDTSSVAIAIAHQRLATAVHPHWLLQDSEEGAAQEAKLNGNALAKPYGHDPSKGFVCDRLPNVTAAILAYGLDESPTVFVDRPYKAQSTLRCTGAYTIESESPFRYIDGTVSEEVVDDHSRQIRDRVLDALERSGVRTPQNGRGEHWDVSQVSVRRGDKNATTKRLVTHTAYLHSEAKGKATDNAVIGIAVAPEDTMVSDMFVKTALQQLQETRVDGRTPTTLMVIGFAFESAVTSPRLKKKNGHNIVLVQANRDLTIQELRDQDSNRSFVMLAEPNITVTTFSDRTIQLSIDGFHTFNPRTQKIMQGQKHEVQMWMVDRDYDNRVFRAHELHFTNEADSQVCRLKKALETQLDEDAWKLMLSNKSQRFCAGVHERAAVRMITYSGTEITGVVDLRKTTAKAKPRRQTK